MNERDKLIARLIKEKGGSREDYLHLLNSISHHESAGTMDPTIKQIGGGPGRGKYQFETGKHGGAITAAKRAKKYYSNNGIPLPNWLSKASSGDDLDVSSLSSEQQDILFLGNMREHPKANFSNIWDGKESVSDFWANYHWGGPKRQRKERIKSFGKTLDKYPEPQHVATNDVIRREETPPPTKEFSFNPDFLKQVNQKAMGGNISEDDFDKELNSFNGGGTHEQNPLGGIPLGLGNNGKRNTVESKETSFNLKNGKFIFSHRIKL